MRLTSASFAFAMLVNSTAGAASGFVADMA
jgi:hypothetical protein